MAASKLHIPVAHLRHCDEARGSNPLFCPTEAAVKNLANEGIIRGVYTVGDIMLDASLYYRQILKDEKTVGTNRLKNIQSLPFEIVDGSYALATIHRAENTDDLEKLIHIVGALNELKTNFILPLHPRTLKCIAEAGLHFNSNVYVIEPIGYLEMLELEMNCTCIITDSGGIQKEAYFLQKPCITLREQTEWVETVESGWNILAGSNKEKIKEAFKNISIPKYYPDYYGNGITGNEILIQL